MIKNLALQNGTLLVGGGGEALACRHPELFRRSKASLKASLNLGHKTGHNRAKKSEVITALLNSGPQIAFDVIPSNVRCPVNDPHGFQSYFPKEGNAATNGVLGACEDPGVSLYYHSHIQPKSCQHRHVPLECAGRVAEQR